MLLLAPAWTCSRADPATGQVLRNRLDSLQRHHRDIDLFDRYFTVTSDTTGRQLHALTTWKDWATGNPSPTSSWPHRGYGLDISNGRPSTVIVRVPTSPSNEISRR